MSFGGMFEEDDEGTVAPLISEINMIPLVDVMLVLLVVFMVAAPLSYSGIDVRLPASGASAEKKREKKEESVVVSVTERGELFVEKKQYSEAELQNYLRNASGKLLIRADKDVDYGRVVTVMNAGKQAGIGQISLVVVREDIGSAPR